MNLVDTHCHIHQPEYGFDQTQTLLDAARDGVKKIICIGTDPVDSRLAVDFARQHQNVWSAIGIHPHEADKYFNTDLQTFMKLVDNEKVVAIGECGLDYFYNHSSKESQEAIFRIQIELAISKDLPMCFHVRDAFDDFFRIIKDYSKLRGVIHSFTDSRQVLNKLLDMGFFIGVNGIVTFCKDPAQLEMYRQIPIERLLLETDAPYLTPVPFRGMMCEPKHVKVTANFISNLKNISLEDVARLTSDNALRLFKI